MEDIYLIPLRLKPFNLTIESIYLKDIYCIYPKEYAKKIGNICIRYYENKDSNYDVIHIGEVIEKIKEQVKTCSFFHLRILVLTNNECWHNSYIAVVCIPKIKSTIAHSTYHIIKVISKGIC